MTAAKRIEAERVARSACFGDLNDEMWRGASSELEVASFICECGHETCTEGVELRAAEYEALGRGRDRFVLAPGHEGVGNRGTSIETRGRHRRRSFQERLVARLPARDLERVAWS